MSKKSRKKKSVQNRKPLLSHIAITKTYFDDFSRTARKFMKFIGLEPSDYDALSKRTKEQLMQVRNTPYRTLAEKGSRVPRRYLDFFNYAITVHARRNFFGDPAFNITFMEYITHGVSLIIAVQNCKTQKYYGYPGQSELLDKIADALDTDFMDNEEEKFLNHISRLLKTLLMYVSRPNYRYYTCEPQPVANYQRGRIDNQFIVSSIEPERKYFIIDGKSHSAYRLQIYNLFNPDEEMAPVPAEILTDILSGKIDITANPEISDEETYILLPVYIQSHVLRRAAERMDNKDNIYLNHVLMLSMLAPKVVTAVNGQRLIKALDITNKPVGYFPFTIMNDAVLLLSFLPLSSPITPEGSVLQKELKIKVLDSKYLGMDKFSFYTNTDFDAVPKLKNALQKADMWHLTEIIPDEKAERREDQILKHFFTENLPATPLHNEEI